VRLISCRTAAGETLGVVVGDRWLPADEVVAGGPATMDELLAHGPEAVATLRDSIAGAAIEDRGHPLDAADLLAPVPRPGKIVAIGRNYREHAAEEGVAPPPAPLIFAKWPSSVVGPGSIVSWDPALSAQVDYEAELAVVIGRTARHVTVAAALDHVFGYTCLNDVSARDIQFGDGQWVRGKSLDTFCPMGPALVTPDEVGDPQDLAICCTVGAERVQEARTSAMYFGVAEIISYCSRSFTLEPGDVIATGTPGGVGFARQPPVWLQPGDTIEIEIEGVGRIANRVVAEERELDEWPWNPPVSETAVL
jgi:2-keto-4-pentenoate hydratase/2-oxohepta-3-ene-1,7-dioic acid hydratase in catechol pathway